MGKETQTIQTINPFNEEINLTCRLTACESTHNQS